MSHQYCPLVGWSGRCNHVAIFKSKISSALCKYNFQDMRFQTRLWLSECRSVAVGQPNAQQQATDRSRFFFAQRKQHDTMHLLDCSAHNFEFGKSAQQSNMFITNNFSPQNSVAPVLCFSKLISCEHAKVQRKTYHCRFFFWTSRPQSKWILTWRVTWIEAGSTLSICACHPMIPWIQLELWRHECTAMHFALLLCSFSSRFNQISLSET